MDILDRLTKYVQIHVCDGIKLGQGKGKSKLDKHKEYILKLVSLGIPKTLIAKQYQTTKSNLYNFLNRVQEINVD